ncbi:serine/threonine-protein kinase [Nannocystis sp. SCPEA4]|uniref:serine/threonine-protein kinase n=1 Tax=Nannocystis sp. SCPEA4 TaxID=2996787 RepID=UPI00226EF4AC|nr:serine/threonine-protein kinase [Nannocystis sp. SCPEA4]MCY1059082.1 serine/threonine-protein kinase [Nannocystis sp. SCPEA4]
MTDASEQPATDPVEDEATARKLPRPPPDPYIGLEIEARYRIERKLGAGGMGRVYLGRHLRTGAALAIKLVESHPSRSAEVQTRCFNEARAMMEVRSSHVAHAIDVGSLPHGELYLVMEYLRGEDLEVLLRREGPLPWSRLAPIALQLCSGLGSAHRQGIIHRDIKPSNCVRITIDDNPDHIKIIDFGIARDIDAPTGPTQKGTVIGTPEYLAPELVTGDARAGIRTDIYALGATLYKLLTGVSPFRGDTAFEVMGKHVMGERIPPSRAVPHLGIPAAVDAVILRTLAAKPENRYASTEELAQAIAATLGIQRSGVSGPAFRTPATAVLVQPPGSDPHSAAGHGSTTETITPRAITTRVVTLLSTIGMFVVATRLVMPADESTDASTAAASPDATEAPALLARSPDPNPPTDPRPPVDEPKGMPRETPPTPAEAPAVAAEDEPKDMPRETPPPPADATQQPAPPAAAPGDEPKHMPLETAPVPAEAAPEPEPHPEAKQTTPAPPQTAPAPKPRPEPGFPYIAARSEIAQQLKYLRATCMMTSGLVTSKVKFRVDVTPSGTANVRVYSGDRELRACFRKALSFPFGKSPRGGAFVYTLTQSSAEFMPVPLEPGKADAP